MKKYLLIAVVAVLSLFTAIAPVNGESHREEKEENADNLKLAATAKSAILIERDTGQVIFKKNENEVLPPASMTKIMTLLLIMEALDKGELKLDEMVRVSERAASMGGTQIFLEAGEEMSVKDMLKGIAIGSANDASMALAERIGGSEEAFVKKMNEKAKALSLEHTKFQNPSGLPAKDHYTTAHDLAIMAKELLKYETITDYTSIYEDYLRKGKENEFWLVNTNKLVKFYPGVDGLKTGYTSEAKYGLTASAEKDGMRLIAVVMGAETSKERNQMVSGMLDYAFSQYDTTRLFNKGDVITHLEMLKADHAQTPVVASESVSTMFKKGNPSENISTTVNMDKDITLPLKAGDRVGTLVVKDGDRVMSQTPLIIDRDLSKASVYMLFKRAMQEIAKKD
ncbi:Serine-type D-Ala-D-Ala carboxypeptidase [Lentibacillus sp. JNUCC-1]|uniref:D-alanyl-D-alanine carboxypeptidase family protein n=1 Tax=Lentibacillus sp. JNUCC-1 TaxID=2654513 RepID=UPI0012E755B1|nr:D-alanyl-D-alanine carboxypeptidase family protein [Lentibacillus sp. JNUCC-1]MUV39724.1 Serine-type D-Ala-D-Ala carboxypeptidase [Lentibacillus sp. JNUCC-1]